MSGACKRKVIRMNSQPQDTEVVTASRLPAKLGNDEDSLDFCTTEIESVSAEATSRTQKMRNPFQAPQPVISVSPERKRSRPSAASPRKAPRSINQPPKPAQLQRPKLNLNPSVFKSSLDAIKAQAKDDENGQNRVTPTGKTFCRKISSTDTTSISLVKSVSVEPGQAIPAEIGGQLAEEVEETPTERSRRLSKNQEFPLATEPGDESLKILDPEQQPKRSRHRKSKKKKKIQKESVAGIEPEDPPPTAPTKSTKSARRHSQAAQSCSPSTPARSRSPENSTLARSKVSRSQSPRKTRHQASTSGEDGNRRSASSKVKSRSKSHRSRSAGKPSRDQQIRLSRSRSPEERRKSSRTTTSQSGSPVADRDQHENFPSQRIKSSRKGKSDRRNRSQPSLGKNLTANGNSDMKDQTEPYCDSREPHRGQASGKGKAGSSKSARSKSPRKPRQTFPFPSDQPVKRPFPVPSTPDSSSPPHRVTRERKSSKDTVLDNHVQADRQNGPARQTKSPDRPKQAPARQSPEKLPEKQVTPAAGVSGRNYRVEEETAWNKAVAEPVPGTALTGAGSGFKGSKAYRVYLAKRDSLDSTPDGDLNSPGMARVEESSKTPEKAADQVPAVDTVVKNGIPFSGRFQRQPPLSAWPPSPPAPPPTRVLLPTPPRQTSFRVQTYAFRPPCDGTPPRHGVPSQTSDFPALSIPPWEMQASQDVRHHPPPATPPTVSQATSFRDRFNKTSVQDARMTWSSPAMPNFVSPTSSLPKRPPIPKINRFSRDPGPTRPQLPGPVAPPPAHTPINLGPFQELFQTALPKNVKFFDSHTHFCFTLNKLESCSVTSYAGIRARFPELFPASYGGAIQVFCHPSSLRRTGQWTDRLMDGTEGELFFTYGLHPNWADAWDDGLRQGLEANMQQARGLGRLVGLGEIGLDYSRNKSGEEVRAKQRKVFSEQLQIASRWGLPVVLHCRNDDGPTGNHQAELDCFELCCQLLKHDHLIHRHCFTGTFQEAEMWRSHFYNIGFGFTPSKNGKRMPAWDAVQRLPLSVIMLETDAPYFIPNEMQNFPVDQSGSKVAIPGGLALATAQEISRLRSELLVSVVESTRECVKFIYGV